MCLLILSSGEWPHILMSRMLSGLGRSKQFGVVIQSRRHSTQIHQTHTYRYTHRRDCPAWPLGIHVNSSCVLHPQSELKEAGNCSETSTGPYSQIPDTGVGEGVSVLWGGAAWPFGVISGDRKILGVQTVLVYRRSASPPLIPLWGCFAHGKKPEPQSQAGSGRKRDKRSTTEPFLSLPLEGGLGLWRIHFPPLLFPPFFSSKFFTLVSLGPEVAFYTSKSNLFLHSALFSLSFPQGVRSEAERSRRRKCGGSLVTQPRLTDGWGRSNSMSQPVFTLKAAGAIVMAGFPLLLECAGGKTPLSQEENPWEVAWQDQTGALEDQAGGQVGNLIWG